MYEKISYNGTKKMLMEVCIKMKLVTFNIRCDYEQDGDNNF